MRDKIISGLKDAIKFAKGEPVSARVTRYRLDADTHGKPWAKLSELKPGDILIPDAGFTCMKEGAQMKVAKDHDGSLFLPCDCGGHALIGQADDGQHLVGLYRNSGEL